jgi:hypothetical protein
MLKKVLVGMLALTAVIECSAAEKEIIVFPQDSNSLSILLDGEAYLDVNFTGWGPKWKYANFGGKVEEKDGGAALVNTAKIAPSGATVTLNALLKRAGPRQVVIEIDLKTDKDTELTCIVAALSISEKTFQKKFQATLADGTTKDVELPLAKNGIGEKVKAIALTDKAGNAAKVTLDPPCDIPSDGAARIVLAGSQFEAAKPVKITLTIDVPHDVMLYPSPAKVPFEAGFETWYEFKPDQEYDKPSEIDMQGWLEAPAGKHGRIARDKDRLVYNGKPIKLWGLNLCYSACAPDKKMAEKQAAFYAKYGINAVRLHKYADGSGWSGFQSKDSFAEFDPVGLDRMDYFIAQLKQRGIYVKLSPHFGNLQLGPADKQVVPYLEEFGKFSKENRIGLPPSSVYYTPELHEIQIRQMVNLLKHKNPYTNLTYAEDPAVAVIETVNEQSILFYSSFQPLKASATLRQQVGKRFCEWLRKRYETHEKLAQAWGEKAFDCHEYEGFKPVGEHLDKDNILPIGNPWFWEPEQLTGTQAFRKQRLLDALLFLYELQNEFYAKFQKAVREAGYAGEVTSSNWVAGKAYSNFYNLHSDALIGIVDRHNYIGGTASMLDVPGSGLLSTGMLQVAGHPFMLSEWIHVKPNEWGVEGPAIIGAYAMGLQGWDVSFMFQNRDSGGFSDRIGREQWDVTAPQVLGVFPAVARQVLRGDVKESELVIPRNVHVPSLYGMKLGFDDKVVQDHDVKAFDSAKVPARALAVGRCVVDFTDQYKDTPLFDPAQNTEDGWLVSSTKQLRWKPGTSKFSGCFTLNTPATKAAVGFAKGQRFELGEVTIAPESRFGAIYVTARDADKTIETAEHLLIVAIARARNSGMKVIADERLLDWGKPPILMEPVAATISLRKAGTPTVYVLDHSGRRTEKTVAVQNGAFRIDGAQDKTCYYLVTFKQ